MTKTIFEEMGGTYTQVGDYLLPDLKLPEEEQQANIGVWGMRHKRFLKENHRVLYVERLRIQREEGQYAMHKQTQTANIGAFQVEKQTEVGIAGAEALGHMGENGAGGVDLGNGGTGFNPAAMMVGMALGGAVGQNIAGIMNNSMAGVNQTAPSGATPPPVPVVAYHIAVNGQATGPFDLNVLQQMATSGQFNADSLVWKKGMSEWVKAGTIDELKSMFVVMPPIPPVE